MSAKPYCVWTIAKLAVIGVLATTAAHSVQAKCYTYQTSKQQFKRAELALSRHLQTALICEPYLGDAHIASSQALSARLLMTIGLNPVQISVENAKAKAKARHLSSRYKNQYEAMENAEAVRSCTRRLQTTYRDADGKVTDYLERVCGS
ncbi:MAG: hypothetical protein ABJH63_02905 [Rhizobiaceae bacterium]